VIGAEHSPSLARYFCGITAQDRLSRRREADLATRARAGNRDARDELVRSNLRFVVSVAKEYRNLGIPFEDLLSEGNLGLLEAASRFDGRRGVKFITYAIWWIRRFILKALREQTTLVRVPDHRRRILANVRRETSSLRQQLGREPGRDELSRRLDCAPDEIDRALGIDYRHPAREVGMDGEPRSPAEDLLDPTGATAEEGLLRRELEDRLEQALRRLPARARRILRDRFGLAESPRLTLQEIADREGISRERARQIEHEALARLRRQLAGPPGGGPQILRRPNASITGVC
jgi:RNA polymerase primary sigma factor